MFARVYDYDFMSLPFSQSLFMKVHAATAADLVLVKQHFPHLRDPGATGIWSKHLDQADS